MNKFIFVFSTLFFINAKPMDNEKLAFQNSRRIRDEINTEIVELDKKNAWYRHELFLMGSSETPDYEKLRENNARIAANKAKIDRLKQNLKENEELDFVLQNSNKSEIRTIEEN